MTLVAAILATRPLTDRVRFHGGLVGVVTAALTVPMVFAAVATDQPLYLVAITLKLVAGVMGGALPIGLHLGGNWVQAGLAGFTTPSGSVQALWRIPISTSDMQLLVAPDVRVPRSPHFLAIGTAATLTWMFLRSRRTEAR